MLGTIRVRRPPARWLAPLTLALAIILTGASGARDRAGHIADPPRAFVLEQELVPSPASPGYYGLDVDIDGDTAVVGCYTDSTTGGTWAGGAYVFRRTGTTWALEQRLFAADGAAQDWFGWNVAISGDTIAIGVMKDDTTRGTDVGSVRVFVRSGSTWTQQAMLQPSSAATFFGCGVDVDGDTIVAGHYGGPDRSGPGAVTVFVRSGVTWSEQARLTSPTSPGAAFGRDVALRANTMVVADIMDGTSPLHAGAVHVYERSGTSWGPALSLHASDPSANDWFGYGLAFDGSTIVVGAPGIWDGTPHVDRAFMFERSGATWLQTGRFVVDPATTTSEFRTGVDGGFAAAGAAVYSRGATGWTALGTLHDARPTQAVAISVDTVVIGASDFHAYAFRMGTGLGLGAPCLAELECGSGQCIEGVCCDSACVVGSSACASCRAARTGGSDGTCAPLSPSIAATVTCRYAVDVCDAAETCDPSSTACPTDSFAPSGTTCRASRAACDAAETCSGTSAACPIDAAMAAGTPCRAAADVCDVPETCSGTSYACPVDGFLPFGVACRDAVDRCDTAETCTGGAPSCPPDRFVPDGTPCPNALVCDGAERCLAGACVAAAPIDCSDGDACTNDHCVEPGTCAHDPTCVDAGPGDAATASDAGIADAGQAEDAATLDASVVDGSLADASVRDASVHDASLRADVGDDAGAPPAPRSAGCACGVQHRGGTAGALALTLLLSLAVRRRRSRTSS